MDTTQAAIDVVNGVAIYADLHQWDRLRELYANNVAIDYTALEIQGVKSGWLSTHSNG